MRLTPVLRSRPCAHRSSSEVSAGSFRRELALEHDIIEINRGSGIREAHDPGLPRLIWRLAAYGHGLPLRRELRRTRFGSDQFLRPITKLDPEFAGPGPRGAP